MAGRRWRLDAAMILGLLHGAFLFQLATSQSFIGVNYGTIADNLPPAASTASLLTSTSIGKLRLYEPQPDLVAALAGSNISILLGVPNSDVPSLAASPAAAASWAAANIPTTVSVSAISVGNELLNSGDPTLGPQLLPAMQNLLAALPAGSTTKVSTVHSMAVLASSDPPSSGAFHPDLAGGLDPVLDFLRQNGGPFMVNPYPYFAYASDTRDETLAFCLFQPNPGRVDAASGLTYMNMFDAQLDAVRAALDGKGCAGVDIVVAETGWPYKGDAGEAGARAYNGNLVAHLRSQVGTPRTPGKSVDTYIFALYDEDLKPGPVSERSFGLYQADLTANYDIGLAKGSAAPSTSGQIGVTAAPAQGAPQGGRGITPAGFCVTTGSVPGNTQPQQQSSSCYVPGTAASPRADAGVLLLVLFGVLLGLAMVAPSR
ncbi:glucan endo-1,3-beta-glucosidase 7-like [Hordeum vulgare subsp. vulgare]|uniref:glucan endo-1,3-beta-D-glucosidase n=1 Tax=Hordeum vulgare subsp. vulgare TaxID=112509 RepID=A0A8I6XDU9_HORVV|nr:glucan endo-1,3-beta-glucosidase 7-like [Hordeum vulgare subsp. vulgare]